MKFRTLMMSAAVALSVAPALAADAPPPPAPPTLVRGTIASIDAKSITITKADGTVFTAALSPATAYAVVEPRRFDQIKSTDFVGITSVPGPGDTLKAEEIHILPIHIGEGSYPWMHHPDGAKTAGSMTNGSVAAVHTAPTVAGSMTNGAVTASDGWSLKVTFHGSAMVGGKCVGLAALGGANPCTGIATVAVTPSTPIVAIMPGKPTDAKAGLAVFAAANTGPDGKPVVGSLVLEKNGIKPQM